MKRILFLILIAAQAAWSQIDLGDVPTGTPPTEPQKTQIRLGIGLQNVDNTADADKPISVATQTALNSLVPYTGATANLDLGVHGLNAAYITTADISATVYTSGGFAAFFPQGILLGNNLNGGGTWGISNVSSVASSGTVTGSNLTGINTGDNSVNSLYANDYRAANFVAGTNYLAPNGTAAALTGFPTLNQNTTGSAATLTTPRTINGTSFNGSANITVTAAAGTLTGGTLASGVTASSLTSLGTITIGTWNGTPVADSYISSAGTWNAKQASITFGTGVQTALGVSIGSPGSPVIYNGALGTPTSGVATNLTGTASGVTAGNVTTNANLTGVVTSIGNATSIANGAITNAMLANAAVTNLSGTNTGDNSANSLYASDYRATNFVAGTNYLAPNGSAAALTGFPTLNQNTTGSAATLTTARTINGVAFNGSANISITAAVAAGGSTTNVQYNDAGAAVGSPNFTWDETNKTLELAGTDTEIVLNGVTNEPSAPAAGKMVHYDKSIAGRVVPKVKASNGLDYPLQPAFWQANITMWTPTAATAGFWLGTVGAGAGTYATALPGTASLYATTKRARYSNVVTTLNQVLGQRNTEALYQIGTNPGQGGFFMMARVGADTWTNGGRFFVGLHSGTTVISADPSALNNTVGFCVDAADNGLISFLTRGTAATKAATGYTIVTGKGYDLYMFCAPNANTIGWRIVDINAGTEVSGIASANLPANAVTLTVGALASNAALTTVNAIQLSINRIYMETEY